MRSCRGVVLGALVLLIQGENPNLTFVVGFGNGVDLIDITFLKALFWITVPELRSENSWFDLRWLNPATTTWVVSLLGGVATETGPSSSLCYGNILFSLLLSKGSFYRLIGFWGNQWGWRIEAWAAHYKVLKFWSRWFGEGAWMQDLDSKRQISRQQSRQFLIRTDNERLIN